MVCSRKSSGLGGSITEEVGASRMAVRSTGAPRGMAGSRHTWKTHLEGLVGCNWVANVGS